MTFALFLYGLGPNLNKLLLYICLNCLACGRRQFCGIGWRHGFFLEPRLQSLNKVVGYCVYLRFRAWQQAVYNFSIDNLLPFDTYFLLHGITKLLVQVDWTRYRGNKSSFPLDWAQAAAMNEQQPQATEEEQTTRRSQGAHQKGQRLLCCVHKHGIRCAESEEQGRPEEMGMVAVRNG